MTAESYLLPPFQNEGWSCFHCSMDRYLDDSRERCLDCGYPDDVSWEGSRLRPFGVDWLCNLCSENRFLDELEAYDKIKSGESSPL